MIANYIFIGMPRFNINGAVIGTVICYSIIVIYNYIALVRTTKVRVNMLSVFFKPLFASVLCGVSAFTTYGLLMNVLPEISRGALSLTNIIATCIAIVLAVFVYGIAMLLIGGVCKRRYKYAPEGRKNRETTCKIWIYRVK